jgi:hypothetical protein
MKKLISIFKKIVLAIVVLAVGLVALPASGVFAAALPGETTPPATLPAGNLRLELVWAHAQTVYQRQGYLLSLADDFIARAQILIDRANSKGWDTSAVQTALDAFNSVIPAARSAHFPGAAIITGHNGFNAAGRVTDRTAAIETAKSLVQVLKDTRAAMNGTGRALRAVIKAFRDSHRPDQSTATP